MILEEVGFLHEQEWMTGTHNNTPISSPTSDTASLDSYVQLLSGKLPDGLAELEKKQNNNLEQANTQPN